MNIGLIIAGGTGQRMKMNVPKQFIKVLGKPIIIYTLEAFERNKNIDEVVVVCLQGWEEKHQEAHSHRTRRQVRYGVTS